MSTIQWFPGHMTKTLREMEKDLKLVDIILYVLDSRAPISCVNPKLSSMLKGKSIIYVFNKCDLIEVSKLKQLQQQITKENNFVLLDSTQTNSTKILLPKIDAMAQKSAKIKANLRINNVVRVMVIGVPNCGKSTLINNLCKKAKTEIGNRPGVTKGKQWVTVNDNLQVLDTAGTLWPSFENEQIAHNLAYIGSIKDEVLNLEDLAFDFIKDISEVAPNCLTERYGIALNSKETIEIFDDICKSRKCVLKGGEPDYLRCAKFILDDFRKGKLGKIILDR